MEKTHGHWAWVVWEDCLTLGALEEYCLVEWFAKGKIGGDWEKRSLVVWV